MSTWDEAIDAFDGARIEAVEWGKDEAGRTVLALYFEECGAVEITAIGVRDSAQPFEHGADLSLAYLPHAEFDDGG